jgi:hypothetical protein
MLDNADGGSRTQPIGGVMASPLLIAAAPITSVATTAMLLREGGIV